jgi:hypothetical protein
MINRTSDLILVARSVLKGCHAEVLEACGQRPLRSPFDGLRVTPSARFKCLFIIYDILSKIAGPFKPVTF